MIFDLQTAAEIATDAARLAGDALRTGGGDFEGVASSVGRDIKLHADKAAEALIIDELKRRSSIPILSEEAGWTEESRGAAWIVDPLDGSANYNRGIPFCSVSIGLISEGAPIVGVIYDFHHDGLYLGVVGQGATLNGRPITVSQIDRKADAVLMTGLPVSTDFSETAMHAFADDLPSWKKVRLIGTAATSLAFVAAGKADRYAENSIMIWDVAAGCALVKAAGGRISIMGDDLLKPLDVVADNGRL